MSDEIITYGPDAVCAQCGRRAGSTGHTVPGAHYGSFKIAALWLAYKPAEYDQSPRPVHGPFEPLRQRV